MKAVFIIGPSGSGKTTLANKINELHRQMFGEGSTVSINLDCANESGQIDICNLVNLQEIMEEYQLGPNGSLIYAAQLLEKNIDWLHNEIEISVRKRNPSSSILRNNKAVQSLKLQQIQTDNLLLVFDLPGQPQLYFNHHSIRNIIFALIKQFSLQACLLQLFDSTYIYNLYDFTSMIMMSLANICNIQIPHIGILNKIDLCKGRRPSDGSLTDYFGLPSLQQLLKDNLHLSQKDEVVKAIASIVDQYSKVTFSPCSVYKPDLLFSLFLQLQKIFGTLQNNVLSYKGFAKKVSSLLSDVGAEGVRINLQCQLFEEEEEIDFEEQLKKIRNQK